MEHEMLVRISAVYRDRYELMWEDGSYSFGRLKRSEFLNTNSDMPAVGDFVALRERNTYGDSLIYRIMPRKSIMCRRDPSSAFRSQAIAANMDEILLITSANREYNMKRIHRYLSMVRQSSTEVSIILTKCDTASSVEIDHYCEETRREMPDSNMFPISSQTGFGMKALSAHLLSGKYYALVGSSGVGKSTLINALAGKEIMVTGAVREDDMRGRHTTTHRQMIKMPQGYYLLDTPGMREVGLWEADEGVSKTFSDIEDLVSACKFRNCTHVSEPGCKVLQALNDGSLSKERWEEYRRLYKEATAERPRKKKGFMLNK